MTYKTIIHKLNVVDKDADHAVTVNKINRPPDHFSKVTQADNNMEEIRGK